MNQAVKKKKNSKKAPSLGNAYINASYNNTIVTITTPSGDVVCASSGGKTQRNARKSTAHAAEEAAKYAGARAVDMGMSQICVMIKGPGSGRESAVRGLHTAGLKVLRIVECTPVPHNGCRRRKQKRV
ncbi:MAG: 30S ribosomal protein S11 [Legionellales bacterium]|jgi:small subunit ribosomal protein S11|nr:30S ribosomal protein S11 [Legionellales bacterium]